MTIEVAYQVKIKSILNYSFCLNHKKYPRWRYI